MAFEIGKTGRILNLRELLSDLTADDIYAAARTYERFGGNIESFEKASTYQVIVGEKAYPPKPIFGLAASKKLEQQVRSEHFTGGIGSASFRLLKDLGFEIAMKSDRPSRSEGLELYRTYSREDVQKILAPGDSFTKGAGTWGIQGIIPDRPSQGDFVLFVTLGTYDGNNYEDALTADGTLIWKSQNKHATDSSVIKALINHNEDRNVVYLFLRSGKRKDYAFLGPLAFNDWDPMSSKPVHVIWTLLSGSIPRKIASELDLKIRPSAFPFSQEKLNSAPGVALNETAPPKARKKSGQNGARGAKHTDDWSVRDERNRRLGLAGEKLVIDQEIQNLREAERHDLADQVEHTALINSAAGYDIVSFDPKTGARRFIEVKTTTGAISSAFFISANEVSVSEEHGDSYFIYRVYDYSPNSGGKFYRVNGSVRDLFDLDATNFRATLKV